MNVAWHADIGMEGDVCEAKIGNKGFSCFRGFIANLPEQRDMQALMNSDKRGFKCLSKL